MNTSFEATEVTPISRRFHDKHLQWLGTQWTSGFIEDNGDNNKTSDGMAGVFEAKA